MVPLLIGAAMLVGAAQPLSPHDPAARRLSEACVQAVTRDSGEAPPVRSTLHAMSVRREAGAWRVDYDVTVEERTGRSRRWAGYCSLAAPAVSLLASN